MNLRIKFKCLRCGKESEFGPGAITLMCQACNGYDLSFDQDVVRTPVFAGDRGEPELIKKGQPVLGRHTLGYISNVWEVFPAEVSQDEPEEPEESKEENPKSKSGKLSRRK